MNKFNYVFINQNNIINKDNKKNDISLNTNILQQDKEIINITNKNNIKFDNKEAMIKKL